MTIQGEGSPGPFVRRGLRVLVWVAVVVAAGAYALGLVPDVVVTSMAVGLLVGQFVSKDERAPSDVSGSSSWWRRRARGAFYTAWWVLILLIGVLINVISRAGFGWEAFGVLAVMAWPLWVVVRNPPERPWDPWRLTP